jgi:hypothetical protein
VKEVLPRLIRIARVGKMTYTVIIRKEMIMPHFSRLFVATLFVFAANTQAQLMTDAGYQDLDTCPYSEPFDQYEVPTKISSGSLMYGSGCIDTDRFRPPVILENNEQMIRFANYRHNPRVNGEKTAESYYIAEINKSAAIDAVFFHVVRFPTGVKGVTAAHTQYRMRFVQENAVKLTSQVDGHVVYANDIVISYEASRPKNVPYNFAAGVVDNYLVVARVMSGRQRLDESYANETEQFLLEFPQPGDDWKLLTASLVDGNDIVYKQFYNTLRPNCTTKAFDMIDKLESLQGGNFAPFLTELSPNPIAAPSVEALRDRGILKACYANLRTELDAGQGGVIDCPSQVVGPEFPLLAQVEDYPYSVVVATESESGSEQALRKAKSVAYQLAPKVAANLYGSLMLVSSEEEFSILKTMKRLAPTLKQALEEVNSELSDSPASLSLYLMPWSGEGTEVDVMSTLNVEARLPSDTFETSYTTLSQNERDGLYAAMDANRGSELPVHLLGIALHMTLIKDASTAQIQILGQLSPQTKPLSVENDQVTITRLVVPEAQDFTEPTLVLINLNQDMNSEIPVMNAEFGPYSYADVYGNSGHMVN